MNSIKDFTNVQCAHRLLPGTRQMGSLAPPKHDAMGSCLQCDSDSLVELVYIGRKRGGHKPRSSHIPKEKIAGGQVR